LKLHRRLSRQSTATLTDDATNSLTAEWPMLRGGTFAVQHGRLPAHTARAKALYHS
jgi:hypothetical protein